MSILFFGGLPRAGKSYEAMVTQIIPALQRGREVVAYIEGLNFERIAEASGLAVERVRELLHPLTREDMRNVEFEERGRKIAMDGPWISKTRDNALHVFDEAQNWWPNRHKASEQLTQFVTEHGHRGIDILLMGQALSDVLKLWRNRVEQRLEFEKLTALGMENRYQVTIYKGRGGDEYTKVGSQVNSYDKKYFGTYASHVAESTNTLNYVDARVKVWNNPAVKWGLLAAVGLLVWGASKTWSFFHPADAAAQAKPAQAGAVVATPALPGQVAPVRAVPASVPPPVVEKRDTRSVQERYLADLSGKGRVRLAGIMRGKDGTAGVVEWVTGTSMVVERTTFDQLRALGVQVEVVHQAAYLKLGEWQAIATQWPMESDSRISDDRLERMRPAAAGVTSGEPTTPYELAQAAPAGPVQRREGYSERLAARNAQVRSVIKTN